MHPLRIHCFEHVSFETIGSIASWASSYSLNLTFTRFQEEDPLPDLTTLDILIVMGGPMGVSDEQKYPWLIAEKAFISQAIKSGKKVLGICLGAQLIASVMGANVVSMPQKEIGWFPVNLTKKGMDSSILSTLTSPFWALHWHGDSFEIPKYCDHLAYSEACKNQAFSFDNRIVGLQFHLEITQEGLRRLCEIYAIEASSDPAGPSFEKIAAMLGSPSLFKSCQKRLFSILDTFCFGYFA